MTPFSSFLHTHGTFPNTDSTECVHVHDMGYAGEGYFLNNVQVKPNPIHWGPSSHARSLSNLIELAFGVPAAFLLQACRMHQQTTMATQCRHAWWYWYPGEWLQGGPAYIRIAHRCMRTGWPRRHGDPGVPQGPTRALRRRAPRLCVGHRILPRRQARGPRHGHGHLQRHAAVGRPLHLMCWTCVCSSART